MDIAASAASLTHLSASCITLLAKWIHEVKEVDNVIQDFRAEIETLHNVLISLAKSTARLRPPSDKSVLWIQVNMTLLDTGKALGKLEDILGCFNTENPAIFNKIGRQFKMNLLSGEISVVRQRIGLLSSTLGLPLHMIAIEAQSQKTARDDSAAAAIQSAISKLENLLGQHLPISSSATTEDREIYAHATEIIKTATELASNASVGSGINSFVEAAPEDRSWISDMENGFSEMREESQSSSAFYDDVPSKAIETSIQGEQLSAGEHSRIVGWIPGADLDSDSSKPRSTSHDSSGPFISPDNETPQPIREDLNVRMYGKRMAKGISYMERREFENAVKAFTSAQDDLQRSRSSSITKSMFNEVRLALAKVYTKQGKVDDAEAALNLILCETEGISEAEVFSAKHALGELAFNQGDLERARDLCLDGADGRYTLFGPESAAYYESVKLLVDIHTRLGNVEEADTWRSELPLSELPLAERFIKHSEEIEKLLSLGERRKAAAIACRFLKDNYEIELPWASDAHNKIRWPELEKNIRDSKGCGFSGWADGFATIHFLAMAKPECRAEIEYILDRGADINATCALRSWKPGQDTTGCTPLMCASLCGRIAVCQILLDRGASITAEDSKGKTAMSFAASRGHTEIMTKLLDRGFDVNHRGRTGCTSLFHAALHGQTDVVKWLIRRGASSDFRDRFAQTPLHYAAECDNGSCLAPFLSSGLKVDAVNDDGDQPIHIAAAAGRLEPLAFLLDNGANIDAKGFNGYTPLLYAITKGQHNIVSFLMSKGATLKVKSEGDYGANALEYAAQFGCPSIVRLLINRAPSYCAYWIEKHGDHFSPVHLACSKGNEEILKLLLDSAPASWRIDSATIKSHSRTPLHEAVKSSSVECIDMLLRNGASAIARDASGDTPLHYAASGGCTAGLGRLIDSLPRSCVETYVNFQSGAGRTPLMEAIIGGYERSVELLLREGASVTVKDRNGWSVMDLARKSGRPSILKALMDHSASIGDIHRSLSA